MKSLKVILAYLKNHVWLTILAPACVLIEVGAELMQPDIMAQIVNKGVLERQFDLIVPLGIKMILFTIGGWMAGMLSIYAAGKVSYAFGADMRQNMFARIQRFSFANVDRLETGSLITRITDDVNKVQGVIQASMRLLFRAPFLFIGSIVMVFILDLRMSYILMVLMPLLIFAILFMLRKSFPLFSIVQQKMDRFNTIVEESLSGIRVVKAYVREDEERRRFAVANDDLIDSSLRVSMVMIFMMPVMSLIMHLGVVAVLWFGAYEVDNGYMKVGDIMACTNYLTQILMSLMMAQRVIMSITQAEASMDRINEVLETPCEIAEQTDGEPFPSNASLEFKNVSFGYVGSTKDQLSNINFSIADGETLAIIGGTGSGKTTLVNLIPRFYDTRKGEILIGGVDIKSLDRRSLQKSIGMVMQSTMLFSGTIASNLRMGKEDATEDEMREACRMSQALEFIEPLSDKFDHPIEQDAANVSGGQKQRLSIARTLISKPRILVLDDSLSAVDLITDAKIRRELKKLSMTKIIIAQRISTIKDADKILMLDEGRMIGFGTHDELYATNQVYREIYESQTSSDGKEVTL